MKTRILVLAALFLGVLPVAGIFWYRWDTARNHGLEFGYYGDLNRVQHPLTRLPGVTIVRNWANQDVTMEEFGFDITNAAGQTVPLAFQERDPVRDLSGDRLTQALGQKIEMAVRLAKVSD